MHPMIGKTFSVKIDGVLRVYEIVKIDDGWISMKREGLKGFAYLHEDIHRNLLNKLGYLETDMKSRRSIHFRRH